jgi:transposase InsO family protein
MVSQPGGSTKKSKFTETQIVSILKQADADIPVKDICRQAGISTPTYYQWKSKYGGMGAIEAFDVGVLVGLAGLVREATYWWMIEYNEQHPHDSLGDLTPAEYRQQVPASSTFDVSA